MYACPVTNTMSIELPTYHLLYGLLAPYVIGCFCCRVLQSFEEVVSRYAQQLSLNENETITVPSLIIVAELVSQLHCAVHQ